MLQAALRDELDRRVVPDRLGDEAVHGSTLQGKPVRARQEPDEVCGGEHRPPIDQLHTGHRTGAECQLVWHARGTGVPVDSARGAIDEGKFENVMDRQHGQPLAMTEALARVAGAPRP